MIFVRWLLAGIVGFTLCIAGVNTALANQCAAPGRDLTAAGLTGVVNSYWAATTNVSAGATSISLSGGSGAISNIAAGDLLLIIQMQDATIGTSDTNAYGDGTAGGGSGSTGLVSSGLYEFVRATSAKSFAGAGTVSIAGGTGGGLVNAYTNADYNPATGRGQRRFQIIKVPQYVSASLGPALVAKAWDGQTGGVLVIDVATDLNLNGGSASASGLGFRGGAGRAASGRTGGVNTSYRTLSTLGYHGSKGEGVAGTPAYVNSGGVLLNTGVEGYANGSNARGAPANGGGGGNDGNPLNNDQNTGGGGGAGSGNGGMGGNAWSSGATVGGLGGTGIASGATRLVAGGGGGAGTSNDGTGAPGAGLASSGAAGGGIVIIRAGTISGSGTISASGANANSTVTNDGSGGGGAGGSILIAARSLSTGAALRLEARGGNGGTNTGGGVAHGPGGGGGGGYIASSVTASAVSTGGSAGTTAGGITFGASSGAAGSTQLISASTIPGVSSGAECTPVIVKAFLAEDVGVSQVSRLTLTITNPNPTVALTSISVTDTYPTALRNAANPAATTTCTGGTAVGQANGPTLALTGASVPASGSCTVSADVVATSAGDHVNTIPARDLSGAYGPTPAVNLTAAQATLRVSLPLVASKTAATVSDPLNNTSNPKAIPGSLVDFTIAVSNPSSRATDPNTVFVADAIPAGTQLFVGDIASPGGGPVAYLDGAPPSGLTYAFSNLGSTTDGLEFSNNGGSTFSYTPVPSPQGIDPAVTHVRVKLGGAHAAAGRFSVRFRVRVP